MTCAGWESNPVPLDSETGDQPTGLFELKNTALKGFLCFKSTERLCPHSRRGFFRPQNGDSGAFPPLHNPPLAPLWLPFGFLWLPFGSPLASFGSFGMPLGSFLRFDENWTSLSEQMWQKRWSVVQKLASRNSSPDPPDPADPPEVALGPLLITPLHSRLGPG